MANSSIDRESSFLSKLMTKRLGMPSLIRPLWKESEYEKHRRNSRLFLLGPMGAIVGFITGAITAPTFGVAVVLFAPLTTMAGFGMMYLVAQFETFLRIRGKADQGRWSPIAGLAVDVVGGGLLAGTAAQILGVNVAAGLAVGATILAIASAMRRIFVGDWINDAVGLLTGDLREGTMSFAAQHELLQQGDLEGALELFEDEYIDRDENPAPLVEAARILKDRGRYKRSVEYYMRAMNAPKLDDRRASIFAKQIWEICRQSLSDPEAAIPGLELLVERYPDSPETEWAWRELTVGMVVTHAAEQDRLGAHGAHVPAVKAVERILSEAFVAQASDIHLEDFADGLRMRYRIDGVLQDVDPAPSRIRAAILARIRVMAGLNPAESPLPQDARIQVPFAGREVDIRVSTVPTLHGESLALRVLDAEQGRMGLEELGLLENDLTRLIEVSDRPNGMILATGPGGSGKSTTLHALLRRISTGREKVFTIEDPVEYSIDGVCQISVNHKSGLTFARILRSLVRQDPDVLLVGEIRDTETTEMATHAALTGHLFLTTLHTIDAVSALHQLVDIGVADYLVVHTLEAIMAQRLVRRICPHCTEEREVPKEEALALGESAKGLTSASLGAGCDRYRGTGYKGRIGIYELLLVKEDLRQAFLERKDQSELVRIARDSGMSTLREDGIHKIRDGITTPAEVLRATKAL